MSTKITLPRSYLFAVRALLQPIKTVIAHAIVNPEVKTDGPVVAALERLREAINDVETQP